MLEMIESADPSVASPYLRKDILGNCGLLASIERNVPPMPRTVWIARCNDVVVGAMLVTDGPGQNVVEPRADRRTVLRALLKCLEPGRSYAFRVQTSLRDALLELLPEATFRSEAVQLSVRRTNC